MGQHSAAGPAHRETTLAPARTLDAKSRSGGIPDDPATDYVVHYDLAGKVLRMHPPARRLHGVAWPTLAGRTYRECSGGEHCQGLEAAILEVARTGEPASVELIVDQGGRARCHRMRLAAEQNTDGEATGVIGMGRDVTEEKRIEDTLHFIAGEGWSAGRGEGFFQALVTRLGTLFDADYVLVDRLAEDPGTAETVALYAKGSIVPNMRYSLAGTPCENVMGKSFCHYGRGVQRLFPEDTLLVDMNAESYVGLPLWDSEGRGIGLIAVIDCKPIREVAAMKGLLMLIAARAAAELERARAEDRLVARLREFRTLAENSPDLIARFDRTGRIFYANPAFGAAFDIPAPGWLGRRLTEIDGWPADVARAHQPWLEAVMVSGAANEMELHLDRGDGERWYSVRAVPEHGPDGRVSGVMSIARDMTQRILAERQAVVAAERAMAASQAKTHFLANMSHELRTPLNAVVGFAEALLENSREPLTARQADYCRHIAAAGWYLNGLVGDILDLSAVETRRDPPPLRPVAVAGVLEQVRIIVATQADRHGVVFAVTGGEEPDILVEERGLVQILTNLASNAIKYNRRGGFARLSAARRDGRVRFTVTDDGPGIREDRQDRLFLPFERLGAEATAIEGTGIGLALVKELTRAMNGELGFFSRPDQGSSFWVEFACADPELPMS